MYLPLQLPVVIHWENGPQYTMQLENEYGHYNSLPIPYIKAYIQSGQR